MRHSTSVLAFVALLALAILPACGGGGQGLRNATQPPLGVTSVALPQLMSGEEVDFEIPVSGGCGGPYVLEVIAGGLPDGVATDDADGAHHLRGILLESGDFRFTINITDTGCDPFASTVAEFTWFIGQGPVRIVAASPGIVRNANFTDPLKYQDAWGPDGRTPNGPDGIPGTADDYPASTGDDDNTPGFTCDALETIVYGQMLSYTLIGAGGQPPYVCTLHDDPNDPEDNLGLPTGTAFAVNSTSIVGQPIQVGMGGKPFRVTVRIRDAVGNESFRKFQWKIDTPPIVIATTNLRDGKAGTAYGDSISLVDGVPPLLAELVDDVPGPNADPGDGSDYDDITVVPGSVPVVNTTVNGLGITLSMTGPSPDAKLRATGGRTSYPGASTPGPYGPFPPEGIFFGDQEDDAATLSGIPRRFGQFTIYVHVFSSLVPNERGQHAFLPLTLQIEESEPPAAGKPAFALDPSWTVEGVWPPAPAVATVPEFEIGAAYDPDGDGSPGVRLLAEGGVPSDGYLDAPHTSEKQTDTVNPEGAYKWVATWPNEIPTTNPPAGIAFDPTGILSVGNANLLVRTGAQPVTFEVRDFQLPDTGENATDADFTYSVGPDVSIITYSTTSQTEYDFWWNSTNRFGLNDNSQTIQKMEIFSTSESRSGLSASDMVKGGSVPAIAFTTTPANPIGALLSGATGGDSDLDLLRGIVTATGWWDDNFQMNPKAARHGAHSDINRTDIPYGAFGSSYSNQGNHQPSASSVDLPDIVGGAHDPNTGVYNNGGQMYFFESSNRYGMFVVRPDAKVYVPFAKQKSSTYEGFGDGMLFTKAQNVHGSLRTVQMTVSPDGRVAAFKLKQDMRNPFEHANFSEILFVDLTGAGIFGGATYRIVTSNVGVTGTGGSSSNRVLQASTMALTNDNLYFVFNTQCPSTQSTSSTSYLYRQSWQGLYFMKCPITSGTPQLVTSSDTSWPGQSANNPLQGVTHHHGPNSSSSSSYWGLVETYNGYGYWPYHRYFSEDGMNFHEHNVAPAPFRVSANGKAVAFFAGADTTSTYGTNIYSTYVWVDYDGAGARRASSTPRHHLNSSARSQQIVWGPYEYANWGLFTGPTPGLEISDDGLAVAATYNAYSGSVSPSSYYYSSNWPQAREDIEVARSSGATPWAGFTPSEVTASTFGTPHYWRFGGLTFTAPDGTGASDGLVFWGGAPMYQSASTSSSYTRCNHFVGTYYIYKLGETNTVTSMLATTDGGNPDGAGKVYTATAQMDPASTSGVNNRFGSMHPFGGFLSKNRQFLYVHTVPPISSSNGTCCRLVGLNVTNTVSTSSVNGHPNGRGFAPSNWPSRRGFMSYYYYPYYGMRYSQENDYMPSGTQGMGLQVMAKDTGWVFWGANYQSYGTYSGGSSSYGLFAYPAYYNYGSGYGGLGVYGFDADTGGPVADFTKSGWTSTSTSPYALLTHIEVSRKGEKLLFSWIPQSSYHARNQERVRFVKNIGFNASTGALDSGYSSASDAGDFEASNGRVGESFAVVPGGRDVFYARGGTSNENAMNFTRQRLDSTAGTWTKKAITGTTGTGRINVLWSGR